MGKTRHIRSVQQPGHIATPNPRGTPTKTPKRHRSEEGTPKDAVFPKSLETPQNKGLIGRL